MSTFACTFRPLDRQLVCVDGGDGHKWHQNAKHDKLQCLHNQFHKICSVQRAHQESEELAIGCGSNSGHHGEGCQSLRGRRSWGNRSTLEVGLWCCSYVLLFYFYYGSNSDTLALFLSLSMYMLLCFGRGLCFVRSSSFLTLWGRWHCKVMSASQAAWCVMSNLRRFCLWMDGYSCLAWCMRVMG